MSFIIDAPRSMDSSATLDFHVSTENKADGKLILSFSKNGINLFNSSFSVILFEPGLMTQHQILIKSAPSFNIFSNCLSALSTLINFPPSKKEFGLKFNIPKILGLLKSINLFLIDNFIFLSHCSI